LKSIVAARVGSVWTLELSETGNDGASSALPEDEEAVCCKTGFVTRAGLSTGVEGAVGIGSVNGTMVGTASCLVAEFFLSAGLSCSLLAADPNAGVLPALFVDWAGARLEATDGAPGEAVTPSIANRADSKSGSAPLPEEDRAGKIDASPAEVMPWINSSSALLHCTSHASSLRAAHKSM